MKRLFILLGLIVAFGMMYGKDKLIIRNNLAIVNGTDTLWFERTDSGFVVYSDSTNIYFLKFNVDSIIYSDGSVQTSAFGGFADTAISSNYSTESRGDFTLNGDIIGSGNDIKNVDTIWGNKYMNLPVLDSAIASTYAWGSRDTFGLQGDLMGNNNDIKGIDTIWASAYRNLPALDSAIGANFARETRPYGFKLNGPLRGNSNSITNIDSITGSMTIIASDLEIFTDTDINFHNAPLTNIRSATGDTAIFSVYLNVPSAGDSTWITVITDTTKAKYINLNDANYNYIRSRTPLIIQNNYTTTFEDSTTDVKLAILSTRINSYYKHYSGSGTSEDSVFTTKGWVLENSGSGAPADSNYVKVFTDGLQSRSTNNIDVNDDNLLNVNEIDADTATVGKLIAQKIQYIDTARTGASGTTVLNCRDWNFFKITMGGNITLDLKNQRIGDYKILLIQDGTGSRTVSFSSSEWYAQDGLVNVNTTASSKTLISGFYDGTDMIITEVTYLARP